MIHRFRPIIFLIFVAAFFITASTVLFYTFGYRFNFERGIFIYTGSITLQSNPETVGIRIDGKDVPQKSLGIINRSTHIGGLTPGEHFIEVSAPGYQTWSKKTIVQSGLSTEFWNVLLVKTVSSPTIIENTDSVIKVFRAPKEKLFAVVRKRDNEYSVDTLDTGTGESLRIYTTTEATFNPDNTENIEWTPESDKLIIPLEKDGKRIYVLADISSGKTAYLNDFSHIETPLRAPRWDPSARNFLFFLSGTMLYRINTNLETAQPVVAREGIHTYDLSSRYIYYVGDQNGIVYRVPIEASTVEPTQITLVPSAVDPQSDCSLIVYDEDRLTILERPTGRLFVFNRSIADNPLKEIASGVRGSQFSDDGKKLLFFTDNEISAYFNEDWEAQPLRSADSILQIARFSSALKHVQWTKDYEHILFSLNGTVKVIELDHRNKRNLFDMIAFKQNPLQILSRFEENNIYFLRSDANENENLLESIPFPETTTLFGL